jgi:hypothetical protein
MKKETIDNHETDAALELTIQIPPRLAKRVEAYAKETGNTLTGTVIEALDIFLRQSKYRDD